jgi:alpha-mannosidase
VTSPLSVAQRLDWLEARIDELRSWLDREWLDLDAWTFDGEPLALGARWPDRAGVHRLEHPEVELPWPVEEARLRLDLGGEALVTLVYPNDEVSSGSDPEHRELPIRAPRFTVAAEAVARLPFGMPNRDARLATARAVWIDVALEPLVRRLELVLEAGRALGGHRPLAEAAARALRELEWPSETWAYVSRRAGTDELQNVWELPAGLDPRPPALDEAARETVVAAGDVLDRELAALAERFPPAGALTLTGHAHLDLAWRWPLAESRRKARRTLWTAVGLLERHPDFHFNQSTAQLFAWLEEDDPALLERLQGLAEDGRFEPIGGMWVEPDCVMPAGESLVRQLLYGQRYFADRFGAHHTVCWLLDCFGFTPALPQLLRGAGIERFLTIKLSWSETNRFPHDRFWWEGLDGSRVLAHMFDNPDGGYNGRVGPRAALATWTGREGLLSVGHGDGGGGPTEDMVERVAALDGFPALPAQRFGRVDAFFDRAAAPDLPVWAGELYLELHRGTLTTQGRTKRAHRRAERDLVAAEALRGMEALAGGALPLSLEPAWRVLLRNEFHDILPGSSVREVYEKAEAELAEVSRTAEEAIGDALESLSARLDGEGEGVLVANPDLGARPLRVMLDEVVPGAQAVEGGSVFTRSGEVGGLEVRVASPGSPADPVSAAGRVLENDLVRVELAPDGTLASVRDKRLGREVLDGRGNQLWAYVDKPRQWDAWDLEATYAEDGEEIPAASIDVVEDGPHRAAIRVERRFRASRIVQDVRLWAGSARIDFATRLDWHDRRWLVKTRFPLAVRSPRATFETAFGVVERPTHRNTSWDQARFEVAGHRFADLAQPEFGVALLNDGRYGHHALGSELGLSLLRSPVWPDPLADEGLQEVIYSLLPHPGGWLEGGVLAEAADLNRPLPARAVERGAGMSLQPLRVDGLPLGLGALKALEDGRGLLLRAYEPRGARGRVQLTVPDGWAADARLDLLERETGPPELELGPFEVATWRLTPGTPATGRPGSKGAKRALAGPSPAPAAGPSRGAPRRGAGRSP